MLGVGDGVADDALEERLENTTGLLVDHFSRLATSSMRGRREKHTGRDTLDTTTASETTDGGLGYALDVVSEDLAVALGTALAEALAALAA